jgi:hypothetical protein
VADVVLGIERLQSLVFGEIQSSRSRYLVRMSARSMLANSWSERMFLTVGLPTVLHQGVDTCGPSQLPVRWRASGRAHPCRKWATRRVFAAPTEAFMPCQLRGLLSLRRA